MKIFALFLALTGCAAASSEEKARGGLTVSRRLTSVISVSTESEFNDALADNVVIELTKDIILTATIAINGITGVVINGNGNKVNGGNAVQCFRIENSMGVSFNDLTITNGKATYQGGAVYIEKSTASFTSCTLSSNEANNGGAVYILNAAASFTSCTLSSNESRDRGGGIFLSYDATLDLIGCAFSVNTAAGLGKDIYRLGTLNFYSLCPASKEYAGTGSLDCHDCAGPADLSASECTSCDEGTSSCCGATECSASAPSCSATEEAMCPAPDPSGTCFHGATQVTLEDKSTKAMTELQVGDKIQTADIHGNLDFAPIISLPHKPGNSEMATFLKIATDSGKSVQMTPGHLIPNCAGKMFSANEVALGDCVMTVDGKETVSEITSATHFGVYTAVTAHALIVADSIIASPFSVENDPHRHKDNNGISSPFLFFLNKISAKVSTGLRGAKVE